MSGKEGKWSDKGMEEDESLKKTIECLRARLVAERQHSRTARENADQLSNKLKGLENKLKEETKMRDRAEKKLRLLQTKMESMKVAVILEDSEQQKCSSISENSLISCGSSTTTVAPSTTKQSQEQEPDYQIRNRVVSVKSDKSQETADPKQTDSSSFTGNDHNSATTEISSGACNEKVRPELEVFKADDQRTVSEEDDDDGVDSSLALVIVNDAVAYESRWTGELKTTSRSVCEVLEALRLAREGIQRSMRQKQKHTVKLGPAQAQAC